MTYYDICMKYLNEFFEANSEKSEMEIISEIKDMAHKGGNPMFAIWEDYVDNLLDMLEKDGIM